jgi:hypothetical protein
MPNLYDQVPQPVLVWQRYHRTIRVTHIVVILADPNE